MKFKKAVLIRRLLVDLILSEPQDMIINKQDAKELGAGPWNALISLAYSKEKVAPKDEMAKFIEILKTVKQEKWSKYLMIEQILPMVESMKPEMWGHVKKSFEHVMTFDPANYLTKVKVPVLAIFGEADTSVPVKKSVKIYKQCLKEANNKKLTVKVFSKASHGINVEGKPAEGFYSTMTEWLKDLKF